MLTASGCIQGNAQHGQNPPGCDYRRIRENTANVGRLQSAISKFNRARIQFADANALINKYSPFNLDNAGWPTVPLPTEAQCQNAPAALVAQLNGHIKPFLRNAGAQIWVSARGARRLKCVRGFPAIQYPAGMATRNRYFQMGVSYTYKAIANLTAAGALVTQHGLDFDIENDERQVMQRMAQGGAQPTTAQWRVILRTLRSRRDKAHPLPEDAGQVAADLAVGALAAQLQAGAEAAGQQAEIQAAAAAAAEQEVILDTVADMDPDELQAFLAEF